MALSPEWTQVNSAGTTMGAGLVYVEDKESKASGFEEDAASTERVFIVRPGQNNAVLTKFVDDLLGYSAWDPGTGDPPIKLKRVLPDRHPRWRNWYCTKARVEGFGVAGKSADAHPAAVHDRARVFAYYEPVKYFVASDDRVTHESQRFCRFTYQDNVEFLTLSGRMRFVTPIPPEAAGRILDHPPGKLHITRLLSVEWLKVPGYVGNPFRNPVEAYHLENVGKVNGSEWLGHPRGTVLYLGAEPRMVTPATAEDRWLWNIKFNFAIKFHGERTIGAPPPISVGHNFLWDIAANRWDLVTHDGTPTGYRIYLEEGEFGNLFLPR